MLANTQKNSSAPTIKQQPMLFSAISTLRDSETSVLSNGGSSPVSIIPHAQVTAEHVNDEKAPLLSKTVASVIMPINIPTTIIPALANPRHNAVVDEIASQSCKSVEAAVGLIFVSYFGGAVIGAISSNVGYKLMRDTQHWNVSEINYDDIDNALASGHQILFFINLLAVKAGMSVLNAYNGSKIEDVASNCINRGYQKLLLSELMLIAFGLIQGALSALLGMKVVGALPEEHTDFAIAVGASGYAVLLLFAPLFYVTCGPQQASSSVEIEMESDSEPDTEAGARANLGSPRHKFS